MFQCATLLEIRQTGTHWTVYIRKIVRQLIYIYIDGIGLFVPRSGVVSVIP